MSTIRELISAILKEIDMYYDYTFRVWPEKCYPLIVSLAEKIGELEGYLEKKDGQHMQKILVHILSALEQKDYVLVRDLWHYDMREFLLMLNKRKRGLLQ